MNKNLIMFIIIAILIGAGSFYAGMKYQESKRSTAFRQFANGQGTRTGQLQGAGNRTGFRPVNGEIIDVDDKSITVKMQDGSNRIILVSEKTEINKADEAKKEDLKIGETVAVFGQENSDGSVTAQNIQLNPILRSITGFPQPSN